MNADAAGVPLKEYFLIMRSAPAECIVLAARIIARAVRRLE